MKDNVAYYTASSAIQRETWKYDGITGIYDAIDYEDYVAEDFGIVSSVSSKDKITFVSGASLSEVSGDVVFWNMDTKEFVLPSDLEKGDVLYYAGTVGAQVFME